VSDVYKGSHVPDRAPLQPHHPPNFDLEQIDITDEDDEILLSDVESDSQKKDFEEGPKKMPIKSLDITDDQITHTPNMEEIIEESKGFTDSDKLIVHISEICVRQGFRATKHTDKLF